MTARPYKSKPLHILKQNLESARLTMVKHAKPGGDQVTHDRAKSIYEDTRKELDRRALDGGRP